MLDNTKKKIAVLVIDMLNEYLNSKGKIYCKDCRAIIPNVKKLVIYARKKGFKVIYVDTSHINAREPEIEKWGMHAMRGTWGARVIPELKPQKNDIIVTKKTYDGFYNTKLESTLRKLDIQTVVVSGIHTHVCVLLTALGAFYRGFKVIALEDCMTTGYKPNHENRLRFFKTHVGELLKLNDFLKQCEKIDG